MSKNMQEILAWLEKRRKEIAIWHSLPSNVNRNLITKT